MMVVVVVVVVEGECNSGGNSVSCLDVRRKGVRRIAVMLVLVEVVD